jgi:Fe-S oxidoreductase/nitrate reductase gamma subunit
MTIATLLFVLLVVLGAGFFSYNAQRLVRYLMIGRPDNRMGDVETRTRNLVSIGLLQSKILRDPVAGAMHATVFWGFLVLTAGTIEIFLQGVVPGFTYARVLGPLYAPYVVMQEVFALLVLLAVGWLVYRRLVIRPKRLQGDKLEQGDALLILSMIAGLMITLFMIYGFSEVVAPGSLPATRFISWGVSHLLNGISPATAATLMVASWWVHVVLVLVFLNYLPYSKHLHVITSLPNVYLSNTSGPGRIGVMRPMDLEAEGVEHFGAADVDQLSWKNLLDGFSCTECGRCTSACPANITGKLLSPRKIVINVRERLLEKAPGVVGTSFDGVVESAGDLVHGEGENEPEGRLLDTFISEEELWACTSCRACVTECPVSIDQLDTINELRRHLVLMESRFPAEVQPVFQSMERNGTPWAFNAADRGEWAAGMNILTVAEMAAVGRTPELLFWVGCMGSFDARAKKITVAFARIMQAAGIDFAILGQEEQCHGDPARRMGNEYLYQMLAKATIGQLNGYGIRTVVTICPHCFHQMGNEFPDLGGNYEVIHHSVYIERLLAEGRVPLAATNGGVQSITYHDSCYLGRYNDVYDAPREALRRVLPIVHVVEPERNRSRGLCCGAGGGRMWMEETQGTRINMERTTELLATGAEAIAAACPFCMTMLTDGVKAHDSTVPVLDIAEVVASRLASVPA